MKKKLLAILSLACSVAMCAVIGVTLLNNNVKTAHAEGESYTKEIGGVTYTFEHDFNNLDYTGLGEVIGSKGMRTTVGQTIFSHANNAGTGYLSSAMVAKKLDADFTKSSGGIEFELDSEGGWKQGNRAEFLFGDLSFSLMAHYYSGNRTRLAMNVNTFAKEGALDKASAINWTNSNNGATSHCMWNTVFDLEDPSVTSSNYIQKEGWIKVQAYKNACTAIGGDASAAKGYWLYFAVTAPGATTPVVIHNGYINSALYTDNYDAVALGFAAGVGTTYAKVRDITPTLVVEKEVCTDIASYGVSEEAYLEGKEVASTTYRVVDNALKKAHATQLPLGAEFRFKENKTKDELKALMSASNYTGNLYYYLNVWMGSSLLDIYLDNALTHFNIRTAWFDTSASGNGGAKYEHNQTKVYPFEAGVEYAMRVTRASVGPKAGANDRTYGSVIRVYMSKIDPETGVPAEGWNKTPVYEHFVDRDRVSSWNSLNNVCVQPGHINNNAAMPHSMTLSSNASVGVKVEINGEVQLLKIARGSDFSYDSLIDTDNMLLIGWSKGAETYSEEDFIAAGKVYKNIQKSMLDPVRALTMTLNADEAASIRFRQRMQDGQYLPLEVSLKWNISASDENNLASYFGGMKLGYKLSASNGACIEREIDKVSGGLSEPFSCGVIQSNIGEASYGIKFTCQAYVELGGMKFYSAAPDMECDGRSVNIVADRAAADLRAEADDTYKNEILDAEGSVLGYHYLTQAQYDLILSCCSENE